MAKVSDEFTVPLCRSHHRELHRARNEMRWWAQFGIQPKSIAYKLWTQTHPAPSPAHPPGSNVEAPVPSAQTIGRDRPIGFDLPEIKSAADVAKASSSVLAACAAGTLSTREAAKVMNLITTHIKILETTEFEARLSALEKAR